MDKKIYIFLSIVALLVWSCVGEMPTGEPLQCDDSSPMVVYASIKGSGHAASRAAITEINDQWSYVGFEDKDVMGFYSSGGNWTDDNGKGNFDNLKLEYDADNKHFTDLTNGVNFSPSNMDGSKIFMYFPYADDMNTTGLELRRKKEGNDTLRCVDMLSSNSISLQGVVDGKKVALFGEFDHAFSELIIMRGVGFDNPPVGCERITAVLRDGYTHVRINLNTDDDQWSCTPELIYSAGTTGIESEEAARSWDAWRGGNYGITENDKVGREAWYVIVPTLQEKRSEVEYIELYDNEGNLLRVTSLRLSGGNTKYVDPGWRYPMEITMKELVPTVNPFIVVPWSGDINLTDERKRGINNETEFAQWVRDYNAYLLDPTDETKINALLKYGDTFVDTDGNNRSWHFYVLADLDLSNYRVQPGQDGDNSGDGGLGDDADAATISYIIPELKDVLDGISTTLVDSKFINHTITGLSKTFINKISGNGSVQNFDFIQPEVRNAEEMNTPAGIVVNTMEGEGTSVVNCNIDDGTMFNPGGPAGMVVGSMNGGQIRNCILSGFLVASKTASGDAAKIAGQISGSTTFTNNDADAVIEDNEKD